MNGQVRRKLRFGLAGALLAAVCLLVVFEELGTRPLRNTQARLDVLQSQWLPSTLAMQELRAQLGELRTYELAQVAHASDPTRVADYDLRMAVCLKSIQRALSDYEASRPPIEQAPLVAQIKQKLDTYLALHARIGQAVHAHNTALADALSITQAQPLRRDLFADIVGLTEQVNNQQSPTPLAQR